MLLDGKNLFLKLCCRAEVLLPLLPHQGSCCFRKGGPEGGSSSHPSMPCSAMVWGADCALLLPLQLARISGRLRVLEEQCHAWRQKEALMYSVMISACLINTWLWLRR